LIRQRHSVCGRNRVEAPEPAEGTKCEANYTEEILWPGESLVSRVAMLS
jgi:hypothetical protein